MLPKEGPRLGPRPSFVTLNVMKFWSKLMFGALLLAPLGTSRAMPPAYPVPATARAAAAPVDATEQAELDRASIEGKELWFGNQCGVCHRDYVSFARTDYARFRVVHEPAGRDMVPGSIEALLLQRYKTRLTAQDYSTVAAWVTAWTQQLELRRRTYQNVRSLAPGGTTRPAAP